MKFYLIVTFILFVDFGYFKCSVDARTSDELRITLPNESKLIGRALRSHDGRPIKAFMGIPYAKPPIGELRFKVNSDYIY